MSSDHEGYTSWQILCPNYLPEKIIAEIELKVKCAVCEVTCVGACVHIISQIFTTLMRRNPKLELHDNFTVQEIHWEVTRSSADEVLTLFNGKLRIYFHDRNPPLVPVLTQQNQA
jgi:hypothetical protein